MGWTAKTNGPSPGRRQTIDHDRRWYVFNFAWRGPLYHYMLAAILFRFHYARKAHKVIGADLRMLSRLLLIIARLLASLTCRRHSSRPR